MIRKGTPAGRTGRKRGCVKVETRTAAFCVCLVKFIGSVRPSIQSSHKSNLITRCCYEINSSNFIHQVVYQYSLSGLFTGLRSKLINGDLTKAKVLLSYTRFLSCISFSVCYCRQEDGRQRLEEAGSKCEKTAALPGRLQVSGLHQRVALL